MNDEINRSMNALAEARARALAEDTQSNGVVVLIWHSVDQMAVGHCVAGSPDEAERESARMLREAADECSTRRAPSHDAPAVTETMVDAGSAALARAGQWLKWPSRDGVRAMINAALAVKPI